MRQFDKTCYNCDWKHQIALAQYAAGYDRTRCFTSTWGWRNCSWFLLDNCTASRSESPSAPHTARLHHTDTTRVTLLLYDTLQC